MTPARILSDLSRAGLLLHLAGERLRLSGPPEAVAALSPLVRAHKAEIIAILAHAIPSHVATALDDAGYAQDLTAWTPLACRAFLAQLVAEWPAFRVRGWYGLAMPPPWPRALRCAVQSVYVQAMQDDHPLNTFHTRSQK